MKLGVGLPTAGVPTERRGARMEEHIEQVLEDLGRLAGSGADHVLWDHSDDVDEHLGLLAELRRAI